MNNFYIYKLISMSIMSISSVLLGKFYVNISVLEEMLIYSYRSENIPIFSIMSSSLSISLTMLVFILLNSIERIGTIIGIDTIFSIIRRWNYSSINNIISYKILSITRDNIIEIEKGLIEYIIKDKVKWI